MWLMEVYMVSKYVCAYINSVHVFLGVFSSYYTRDNVYVPLIHL